MSPENRRWKRRFLLNTIIYRFQCYFWDVCTFVYHWNGRRVCKLRFVFCSLLKNDFSASESDVFFSRDKSTKTLVGNTPEFTFPETNSKRPLKMGHPTRKFIFQPSIFRGEHLSFREAFFTCHGFTFFFLGSSPERNIDETPWEKRT